jgi:hypothetical protein
VGLSLFYIYKLYKEISFNNLCIAEQVEWLKIKKLGVKISCVQYDEISANYINLFTSDTFWSTT